MGYERIMLPIEWETAEPPRELAGLNRRVHRSKCGHVQIFPSGGPEGSLLWKIIVDGIDLDHTAGMLRSQKNYVHRHLLRADQMPLKDGTVVWVYIERASGPLQLQGVRFSRDKQVDDLAREAAGFGKSTKIYRRIVSPRQDRLD